MKNNPIWKRSLSLILVLAMLLTLDISGSAFGLARAWAEDGEASEAYVSDEINEPEDSAERNCEDTAPGQTERSDDSSDSAAGEGTLVPEADESTEAAEESNVTEEGADADTQSEDSEEIPEAELMYSAAILVWNGSAYYEYETLEDAVKKANEWSADRDSVVITLKQDVQLDTALTLEHTLKLDTYGHKITSTQLQEGQSSLLICAENSNILIEGLWSKNCMIESYSDTVITVKPSGLLCLNYCDLSCKSENSEACAIDNHGTAYLENSSIVNPAYGHAYALINSGTFYMVSGTMQAGLDGTVFNEGTYFQKDGTVCSTAEQAPAVRNFVHMSMTGGRIIGTAAAVENCGGEIWIKGGEVTTDDPENMGLYTSAVDNIGRDGTITISGGTLYAPYVLRNKDEGSTILVTENADEALLKGRICCEAGSISLSGGNYSEQPADCFLAKGYEAVESSRYEGYPYAVEAVAPVRLEKKTDGVYTLIGKYSSLEEAVEQIEAGDDVRLALAADLTAEKTLLIPEESTVLLELDEWNISSEAGGALFINEGALTIEGKVGAGLENTGNSGNVYVVKNSGSGTLALNGKITLTARAAGGSAYGVYSTSSGRVTAGDGVTIKCTGTDSVGIFCCGELEFNGNLSSHTGGYGGSDCIGIEMSGGRLKLGGEAYIDCIGGDTTETVCGVQLNETEADLSGSIRVQSEKGAAAVSAIDSTITLDLPIISVTASAESEESTFAAPETVPCAGIFAKWSTLTGDVMIETRNSSGAAAAIAAQASEITLRGLAELKVEQAAAAASLALNACILKIENGHIKNAIYCTNEEKTELAGGYYAIKPEESMLAEGCIAAASDETDYPWQVKDLSNVAALLTVGDETVYCETFSDAIAAIPAASENARITLLQDVDTQETTAIQSSAEMVIDLGGFIYQGVLEVKDTACTFVNGTISSLTISSGKASIETDASVKALVNNGELYLMGGRIGTLNNIGMLSAEGGSVVNLMNSGTLCAENTKINVIDNTGSCSLGEGVQLTDLRNNGSVIITDGTYSGQILNLMYMPSEPKPEYTVEISGGSFIGGSSLLNEEGSVKISGGTFASGSKLVNKKDMLVDGGCFANSECEPCIENEGTLTVRSGYFTAREMIPTPAEGREIRTLPPTDSYYKDGFRYAVSAEQLVLVSCSGFEATYGTLDDAIAAVPTDGSPAELTLLKDITEQAPITIGENCCVYLSMNGCRLSGSCEEALLTVKGSLTVTNAAAAQAVLANSGSGAVLCAADGGSIRILASNGTPDHYIRVDGALTVIGSGKLNVFGGSYSADPAEFLESGYHTKLQDSYYIVYPEEAVLLSYTKADASKVEQICVSAAAAVLLAEEAAKNEGVADFSMTLLKDTDETIVFDYSSRTETSPAMSFRLNLSYFRAEGLKVAEGFRVTVTSEGDLFLTLDAVGTVTGDVVNDGRLEITGGAWFGSLINHAGPTDMTVSGGCFKTAVDRETVSLSTGCDLYGSGLTELPWRVGPAAAIACEAELTADGRTEEVPYTSLKTAAQAAAGAEKAVITLCADAAGLTESVKFSGNVALNMAGHTVSGTVTDGLGTGLFINNGELTINGAGTIAADACTAVYNSGTMTAAPTEEGSLTISGRTGVSNSGTFTVYGIEINGVNYGIYNAYVKAADSSAALMEESSAALMDLSGPNLNLNNTLTSIHTANINVNANGNGGIAIYNEGNMNVSLTGAAMNNFSAPNGTGLELAGEANGELSGVCLSGKTSLSVGAGCTLSIKGLGISINGGAVIGGMLIGAVLITAIGKAAADSIANWQKDHSGDKQPEGDVPIEAVVIYEDKSTYYPKVEQANAAANEILSGGEICTLHVLQREGSVSLDFRGASSASVTLTTDVPLSGEITSSLIQNLELSGGTFRGNVTAQSGLSMDNFKLDGDIIMNPPENSSPELMIFGGEVTGSISASGAAVVTVYGGKVGNITAPENIFGRDDNKKPLDDRSYIQLTDRASLNVTGAVNSNIRNLGSGTVDINGAFTVCGYIHNAGSGRLLISGATIEGYIYNSSTYTGQVVVIDQAELHGVMPAAVANWYWPKCRFTQWITEMSTPASFYNFTQTADSSIQITNSKIEKCIYNLNMHPDSLLTMTGCNTGTITAMGKVAITGCNIMGGGSGICLYGNDGALPGTSTTATINGCFISTAARIGISNTGYAVIEVAGTVFNSAETAVKFSGGILKMEGCQIDGGRKGVIIQKSTEFDTAASLTGCTITSVYAAADICCENVTIEDCQLISNQAYALENSADGTKVIHTSMGGDVYSSANLSLEDGCTVIGELTIDGSEAEENIAVTLADSENVHQLGGALTAKGKGSFKFETSGVVFNETAHQSIWAHPDYVGGLRSTKNADAETQVNFPWTLSSDSRCYIYAASLSLDGTLNLCYYITRDGITADDMDSYTLDYSSAGGRVSDSGLKAIAFEKPKGYDVNCLKFIIPVAAKEINERVAVTLRNGTQEETLYIYPAELSDVDRVWSNDFSAEQYCETMADACGDQSSQASLLFLMKAVKSYGYYAQTYFKNELVNPYNTETYDAAHMQLPERVPTHRYTVSGRVVGLNPVSVSFTLTSESKLNYYFKLSEGCSIDDYVFTCNGRTLTPVYSTKDDQQRYVVTLDGINAKELMSDYTLKVTPAAAAESTSELTITYGPWTYAYNISQNKTADSANIGKALYQYAMAAEGYFGE